MGVQNFLLAGWANAPRAVKQACRLGAVVLFALSFLPSRAAAQTTCPGPISTSLTLPANTIVTPGSQNINPCFTLAANGITLDLNGAIIDVTASGNTGVAIDTGTTSNTTIVGNGGIIDTAYSTNAAATTSAITSSGGTSITITGLTINNEPGGSVLCNQSSNDTNWGTGIALDGVAGATISGNTVSCFQTGISVQNSAIGKGGSGSISGNTLYWNIFNMQSGGQSVYSAGIVLNNSSGWSVSGNTIAYNGSPDINGTCVSQSSGPVSCAPALQIITNSNGNSIQNNLVNSNYSVGIYAGPTTSGNTFSGNTALYNTLIDVWDDAPVHSNHWHHNTCGTEGGSLVGSHAC